KSLVKACDGDLSSWPDLLPYAFFTDRITITRATGHSPYYLLFGVHPVLPFDLSEASFMTDAYRSGMSTADLLATRIRQLQKRPEDLERAADVLRQSRLKTKEAFERHFERRLQRGTYAPGELVLVRNIRVAKSLSDKHRARYLGPYQVVRRTSHGAYILQELDG
ncbi:hypothetical protein WOLCODRAFT_52697, partial [Wolfiporia cocos MD-104 SS10]